MFDLFVRTATLDDAGALFSQHPDVSASSTRELRELMQSTLKHYPFLVAECNGQLLGYAYACAHRSLPAFRWSVDVCVEVASGAPDVVEALYLSLIRHLGEQGYMAIYAAVSVHDRPGAELHKRLGFAPIGVHQSIDLQCEADYWCMTLATNAARAEPVAFTALQQRVGVFDS